MNILITGVTETHINHPNRASSTKFASIPELLAKAFTSMEHDVEHGPVNKDTNLDAFDKVFLFLYPLDHNAVHPQGVELVLKERHDAYICLDDWAFQKVLPTWSHIIKPDDLCEHKWLVPLFPWGDSTKMGLDVADIISWDPSPLYEMPPVHKLVWQQRKTEWYNASLSKDAHEWTLAQNLTWPVKAVGGKALGQPRMLESDIVWEYGSYKGVLCPTYEHAGCGWWRIRYLHAAAAGAILGGSPKELAMIHKSYGYTLQEIEQMEDAERQTLAHDQAANLRIATLEETLKKLGTL
jgi:hypothetical protein